MRCKTDIMSGLIDGLPDVIALQCLARVPFSLHLRLQLVCRSWRAALRSPELLKAREEANASEDLLCVLAFEPDNVWQLYDPLADNWITLPVLPSQIRHLARFGVISVHGKLFVLGGGSDGVDPSTGDHDGIFATNEVWAYDPLLRLWSRRAPMLVPRAMFACCALDGKIIVAGGFTNCRKSISKSEIYDPLRDVWDTLPDLNHSHNSTCSGVVIGGKMHVLHKGLSTVQILEDKRQRWDVEDYGWPQGPIAVVQGEYYVLSHGIMFKQEMGGEGARKVVSLAVDLQSRIGFGMIGVGEEIYVVGGVVTNQFIKPLSDVDVLNVGSERPTWRQVKPMSRCQGSVLGCALLTI
ncbi:F-box/kelch-repeat protein SKIP30 [Acorus gramineus]|uniref:F-box/kelch-repeat protein SKIP30 n=1 Tax=Acorus gramineus TaxID=55184 RepID=A0AAV9ATS4_ACOGR|nr:F-box/kelch-repeat protein SKIP30 [Acorus gramineus]